MVLSKSLNYQRTNEQTPALKGISNLRRKCRRSQKGVCTANLILLLDQGNL